MKYITNLIVYFAVMILLSPKDYQNEVVENEVLCNKIIAIKEKYNSRMIMFFSDKEYSNRAGGEMG